MISVWTILSFFTMLVGYNLMSYMLQYMYYWRSRENPLRWKIQQKKTDMISDHASNCWIPLLDLKPNRAKFHKEFASINILIASLFAAIVSETTVAGMNRMTVENLVTYGILNYFLDCVLLITYESLAEYYWHRLMHIKFFFKIFHKYHHYYRSPEPFDDLYIHPVEATGYYCILFGPPFLFACHLYSFLTYMCIMGVLGILDHSGIRISIPFLYSTVDHDLHHSQVNVNYGFPFPIMDYLHQTYASQQ